MGNYYYINVKGNINKFLLKVNINLVSIKYISKREVIIKIKKDDYKKLLKIYGYNYKIINKSGKDKFLDVIKFYKYFLISSFIGLIILLILSNIIFEIDINSNNKDLNNIIREELLNYGIEKYKLKKSFNKNNYIKEKIKQKYNDKIEWIEITNIGTKVKVNIIERKINKVIPNKEIYSIVAKKSGFIKKTIVNKGIKVVEDNNYVNKGDIIISSDVYLNDNLKGKISAEGKVYANVWYKVICEYPVNYYEKIYTNKKRKILFFRIGNKYLELFKYKAFERKELHSLNDKLTNIGFGIEEIREISIKNKKYSNKEVMNKAKLKSKEEISKRLGKDEYIINQKTLNFSDNGSKIILEIFFSVYEEIGEKRVIEGSE